MKTVVIVDYCRSAFTPAFKGGLATVRADDLLGRVVQGLLAKVGVDGAGIEDLIAGCAFPEGEQGMNLARMVVQLAGLPCEVAGVTVNRFCGSSMQAVHQAAGAVQMGAGEAFICCGVESMSRVPMGGYNFMPNPDLYRDMPDAFVSMGASAENLAVQYNLGRTEQDEFAVNSHAKAAKAAQQGWLADEIIPFVTGSGEVRLDECIRPDSNAETLATLPPAFNKNGSVTAGNSSPLTDGAAAVFVCSSDYAKQHGLTAAARIKSIAVSGCRPEIMGIGPVVASQKALQRAGLSLADIDVVELNEAFSAQSLAVLHDLQIAPDKVNLHGGAIALGHPLGATGARIVGKTAQLLHQQGLRYGLATQCIGGGQGIATILEAV